MGRNENVMALEIIFFSFRAQSFIVVLYVWYNWDWDWKWEILEEMIEKRQEHKTSLQVTNPYFIPLSTTKSRKGRWYLLGTEGSKHDKEKKNETWNCYKEIM
jgi:hypothetical protein